MSNCKAEFRSLLPTLIKSFLSTKGEKDNRPLVETTVLLSFNALYSVGKARSWTYLHVQGTNYLERGNNKG